MTIKLRHILAVTAIAAALFASGCGPKPEVADTSAPAPSTAEDSASPAPEVPTVESLKGAVLTERQEGLVFDYIVAGGLPALETRFGKPSGTYQTAADESSTGSAELADGRIYQVQGGLDKSGAAVVMAHGVEGKQGQSPSAADKAFITTIVDGKTTLAAANAYLAKLGATTVRPAVMDPKGLNVPAYVWALKDGTGFMVVDMSGLTAEQLTALEADSEVPFQSLYWDATRWRAY